jgi:D-alanine-D-alanine ligase-like ATP-grasp enzyme
MIPKIEEMILMAFQSVRFKINKNERKNCFEIFGFDFILDSLMNVWLIEINTNPCIEESSPLLQMYLPRMIDDAIKICVDS